MNITDGLIQLLMLLVLLTFHDFARAWAGWKLGDDAPRIKGRISLNPLVHLDLVGSLLLPLLVIFVPSAISRFMIGWSKPVPVNPAYFTKRKWQESLAILSGPAIYLLMAIVLVGAARVGQIFHLSGLASYIEAPEAVNFLRSPDAAGYFHSSEVMTYRFSVGCLIAARLSLFLCFFNFIPLPSLDAAQFLRMAFRLSWEVYDRLSRYGFIMTILVLRIPWVQIILSKSAYGTLGMIAKIFCIK